MMSVRVCTCAGKKSGGSKGGVAQKGVLYVREFLPLRVESDRRFGRVESITEMVGPLRRKVGADGPAAKVY
jgi:hypothetical protein